MLCVCVLGSPGTCFVADEVGWGHISLVCKVSAHLQPHIIYDACMHACCGPVSGLDHIVVCSVLAHHYNWLSLSLPSMVLLSLLNINVRWTRSCLEPMHSCHSTGSASTVVGVMWKCARRCGLGMLNMPNHRGCASDWHM